MGTSPRLRLTALAALGVGTVFATKAMLAAALIDQPPAARRPETITVTQGVSTVTQGVSTVTQAVRYRHDRPPQVVPPHSRGNGFCSIKDFECQTLGREIHVSATGSVYDKRQATRYVWSFRLFDADDKDFKDPLYQEIYDDQVFAPQRLQGPPTFEAVISAPLPPGRYIAELGISNFDPQYPQAGLDAVRDPELSRDRIKAAAGRSIVIE